MIGECSPGMGFIPGERYRRDNQIRGARVLEVRIHLSPAVSRTNVDTGEVPFRGQVTSESLPIPMIAPAEGGQEPRHLVFNAFDAVA